MKQSYLVLNTHKEGYNLTLKKDTTLEKVISETKVDYSESFGYEPEQEDVVIHVMKPGTRSEEVYDLNSNTYSKNVNIVEGIIWSNKDSADFIIIFRNEEGEYFEVQTSTNLQMVIADVKRRYPEENFDLYNEDIHIFSVNPNVTNELLDVTYNIRNDYAE